MQNLDIRSELKEVIKEFHKMNANFIKLFERDSVHKNRINDLEVDLKQLRDKIDTSNNFINKALGALAIIGFAMPIILKFMK